MACCSRASSCKNREPPILILVPHHKCSFEPQACSRTAVVSTSYGACQTALRNQLKSLPLDASARRSAVWAACQGIATLCSHHRQNQRGLSIEDDERLPQNHNRCSVPYRLAPDGQYLRPRCERSAATAAPHYWSNAQPDRLSASNSSLARHTTPSFPRTQVRPRPGHTFISMLRHIRKQEEIKTKRAPLLPFPRDYTVSREQGEKQQAEQMRVKSSPRSSRESRLWRREDSQVQDGSAILGLSRFTNGGQSEFVTQALRQDQRGQLN